MEATDFKVGDRVRVVKKYDCMEKGSEGIIKGADRRRAQIEFYKMMTEVHDIHSCNGLTAPRRGYNVEFGYLEKIEDDLPEMNMDFGELCSESIEEFISKKK